MSGTNNIENDVAISMQAALDAINKVGMRKCGTDEMETAGECLRAVKALPPVTTESKTDELVEIGMLDPGTTIEVSNIQMEILDNAYEDEGGVLCLAKDIRFERPFGVSPLFLVRKDISVKAITESEGDDNE
jgi:hypothetical protein